MKKLYSRLWVPILLLCFTSCMEEQNFDQIENLTLTPWVATGIFHFESDESFINESGFSNGIPFHVQTTNFDAFNREYLAENLLEGKLIYTLSNTTSKELELELEFLDEAGNTLHSQSFVLGPHPSASQTLEVFYGPGDLDPALLTATSALRFTGVNWGDASSVSSDPDPRVVVRVSGEFRVQLQ